MTESMGPSRGEIVVLSTALFCPTLEGTTGLGIGQKMDGFANDWS